MLQQKDCKVSWQGLQKVFKYFILISLRTVATWILQPHFHLKFMLPLPQVELTKPDCIIQKQLSRLAKHFTSDIKSYYTFSVIEQRKHLHQLLLFPPYPLAVVLTRSDFKGTLC